MYGSAHFSVATFIPPFCVIPGRRCFISSSRGAATVPGVPSYLSSRGLTTGSRYFNSCAAAQTILFVSLRDSSYDLAPGVKHRGDKLVYYLSFS